MQAVTPTVHCRLFEDNSAAIELATKDKVRPRTKYMGTKWNHFRHYVEKGEIKILPIDTDDQPVDMFSKPLPRVPFKKHRDFVMGWPHSPNERECDDTAPIRPQAGADDAKAPQAGMDDVTVILGNKVGQAGSAGSHDQNYLSNGSVEKKAGPTSLSISTSKSEHGLALKKKLTDSPVSILNPPERAGH